MKIIKIYSDTCGPCKVLDNNLKAAGIPYESLNIASEEAEDIIEKYEKDQSQLCLRLTMMESYTVRILELLESIILNLYLMKLVGAKFEILEQQPGIDGIYKMIELAGRTCYRSEDKITEDSAKGFVERMIASGHGAMLEHGTVYLLIPYEKAIDALGNNWIHEQYAYNPYSVVAVYDNNYYITTNLRVLVEHNWLDDLKYICEPTENHEKRICVRYTSDIHFYKDTTRHRVFSWAIESTRFCNYIKSRFDSSVSFITPIWLKDEEQEEFEEDLKTVESIYFKWINKGWQPQQAAYFLIQGTKAEIVMTGFASDYKHFFDLRSELAVTGKPHPTVVELVEPLRQEFIKRNYI